MRQCSTLSRCPVSGVHFNPSAYKWMRVIEAAAAGLFLLGEMYFGVAVLEAKTTPWQNSWFALIVTSLLILVGPLVLLDVEQGLAARKIAFQQDSPD